jgi:hypothetical protein
VKAPRPGEYGRAERVRVPWRLVASPWYGDAALAVYVKVAALSQRVEGCTAGVATLARYLGVSKSLVERGLAQLRRPAPDGVVEIPDSVRRSLPGGRGTTARRRVRALGAGEKFVWLPVAACERLTARLLRAYAAIVYAVVRRLPLSEKDLAGLLPHTRGRRAGTGVSVGTASRCIDELESLGWIRVERRAGHQGRHAFELATPGSHDGDGSGAVSGDGSLAYKEDTRTDRRDEPPGAVPPAGGEMPVVEWGKPPARRRRQPPSPVSSRGYSGPPLTFSGRVHEALEPVRWLVERSRVFVQRRIGREVGRQLDTEASVERLRHRFTVRLAATMVEDIRDPGRWLLGVALPRWGCADPDCESGVLWSVGRVCSGCAERARERRVIDGGRVAAQDADRSWAFQGQVGGRVGSVIL